jgi:hypothetical protein
MFLYFLNKKEVSRPLLSATPDRRRWRSRVRRWAGRWPNSPGVVVARHSDGRRPPGRRPRPSSPSSLLPAASLAVGPPSSPFSTEVWRARRCVTATLTCQQESTRLAPRIHRPRYCWHLTESSSYDWTGWHITGDSTLGFGRARLINSTLQVAKDV